MVLAEGDRFERLAAEGWTFDDQPSRCRSCRAEILWGTTPVLRKVPLNLDGTSHFRTCPQADYWRGKGRP